jgi:ABC-type iron transport system FetAB permease component
MDYDMVLNNSIISGKVLYNKLNNAIKKAPLNVNNVSLNQLNEQLNNAGEK